MSWDEPRPFINGTANEATASWSEDVTAHGFKACTLVAGRHLVSDFKVRPTIHWVAVQDEFFQNKESRGKSIHTGSVIMDTWYTGTQCKQISRFSRYRDHYFVSVTHTEPRTFKNAMTVWTEFNSRNGIAYACVRELQNFDGVHKGVVVVRTKCF